MSLCGCPPYGGADQSSLLGPRCPALMPAPGPGQSSARQTVPLTRLPRCSPSHCTPADNERHFIKYVLAFFASSDGIVMENLAARFMSGGRAGLIWRHGSCPGWVVGG